MKITFVAPGFPVNGGVKRILMLSHLLASRGHNVTLIDHCGNGKCDWFNITIPVIVNHNLIESNIPNSDAIIVYECIQPNLALRISSFGDNKGKKYLLVLSYGYQKGDWVNHNISLNNFTKICTTEWLRDSCDSLGQKSNTIRELLLTGVDTEQFHRVKLFGQCYRPPQGIVVGAYYRQDPYVCFEYIERAVAIAKKRHPTLKLITLSGKLNAPSSSFKHYRNPPQEKLREIYSACDIWLCANKIDGLGMPPLEAMTCGACLVTTRTRGNEFYAQHNKTALVSEPGDFQGFLNNFLSVIEDVALRKLLSSNGQAFTKTLTWEDSAKKLEKILLNSSDTIHLSIICTNYNRIDLTKQWLKNIEECWPNQSTQLILIDDCSTDGTREFLTAYKKTKSNWYKERGGELMLILKSKNTGFANTCYVAQQKINGKWALVTQNDVKFSRGSITALINTFEKLEKEIPDLGCIGISGGLVEKNSNGIHIHDWSHWNGDGVVGYKQKLKFDYVQVDFVNGFLMLYKGDVAKEKKIYFDSRYRFYWEDVDLCYQFSRNHNLKCMMVSMEANDIPHIHHMRNQTILKVFPKEYQKVNDEMEKVFYEKWYGKK